MQTAQMINHLWADITKPMSVSEHSPACLTETEPSYTNNVNVPVEPVYNLKDGSPTVND